MTYSVALHIGSRRQPRRRKEREPRGPIPATPPVSEEETALRERLAELERDADPATRQRAAEVYWDTYDAELASGSTVTAAIRAAYRARIAVLERAASLRKQGDSPAPDLDAEFGKDAAACRRVFHLNPQPLASGLLPADLPGGAGLIELHVYPGNRCIVASAPLEAFTPYAFTQALRARFPEAWDMEEGSGDAGERCVLVYVDDPEAALTPDECALFEAVHDRLPPDDAPIGEGAPAGEGGDHDNGDTSGRVPPDAPACVYAGCERPATRRMAFSNDPDAEEFYCDEHADLVRKLCVDPHCADVCCCAAADVILIDMLIGLDGDGAPPTGGAPARFTLPDRATQLADARALLADAQALDRKYTIVALLAAREDAVWRRTWVEWWRDSEDDRHLVVCYDAGDDRGAQDGGAFAELEPAIDAMRAHFARLSGVATEVQ